MISHKHCCIFTHIPKVAGKSILGLFALPELGRDYRQRIDYIQDPYDHHRLLEYRELGFFRSYFKFAFVRNPWDRLVSTFFYLDSGGANPFDDAFRRKYLERFNGNFGAFAKSLQDVISSKHFLPQFSWIYDDDGNLLADFVGRYDNLPGDVQKICRKLGLDASLLTHRNRSSHEHYSEYYDEETKAAVARHYSRDIEYFGFEFENKPA
jgi:hypothetical protein